MTFIALSVLQKIQIYRRRFLFSMSTYVNFQF